jgi:hypothetical protein
MTLLSRDYYELVFVQRGQTISQIASKHHFPREAIIADLIEYGLYNVASGDSVSEHERTYDHSAIGLGGSSIIVGVPHDLVQIGVGGIPETSGYNPVDFEVAGAAAAAIGVHEAANDHTLLHDDSIVDGDTVDVSGAALNDVLTFDGVKWAPAAAPGAVGGEANTASNIGTGGVGPFDSKFGVDLQFKNIIAASARVTVTDNAVTHNIEIDVPAAGAGANVDGGDDAIASGDNSVTVIHTLGVTPEFVGITPLAGFDAPYEVYDRAVGSFKVRYKGGVLQPAGTTGNFTWTAGITPMSADRIVITNPITIHHDDASPIDLVVPTPARCEIVKVAYFPTQNFDGAATTIDIGEDADHGAFLEDVFVPKLTTEDPANAIINKLYASAKNIRCWITPGAGCTQGEGIIVITYVNMV